MQRLLVTLSILLLLPVTIIGQQHNPTHNFLAEELSPWQVCFLSPARNEGPKGIRQENPDGFAHIYLPEGEEMDKKDARLPAGGTTSTVKISNDIGVWHKNPASFTCKTIPSSWPWGWLYLVWGTMVTAVILVLITIRSGHLEKNQNLAEDKVNTNMLELKQEKVEQINLELESRLREQAAQLEETRRLLQEEIAERKRLEAQLLEAQKMKAIGTMAGGLAHDFNNLLMGILGNVSLILSDIKPGQLFYKELKIIDQLVQNGAQLTRQLLSFAKGGQYEVKPIDLNPVLHSTAGMFNRARKEIVFHEAFEENPWVVEVDQGQIEQVLLNLYMNAWQAMPGGGDIYLETQNIAMSEADVQPLDLKPGHYVKVSVTDTGVGMDEATRQRVFEPFFTTKEMGRGTGLGLASVYSIITSHGGRIHVYSEVGKGTCFSFYMPASDKHVQQETIVPEDFSGGTETILLVDDEQMITDIGARLLKKMGYRVLSATSGKEALEIFKKNSEQIDIVILDMIMPSMSGGETYEKLKAENPAVKVLLSSGYSMDGQANEIIKRGCKGFIQKPFRLKLLSQKIREILDHRDQ
jgi:signal transduction histidine kinase